MMIFGAAAQSWKPSVATVAALPTVGNVAGDTRVARDTFLTYVWTGSAWQSTAGSGTFTPSDLTSSTSALTVTGGTGAVGAPASLAIATASDSVPGLLSAADHTTYTGYAASIATNATNIALKAPLASPTFTGTATLPATTVGIAEVFSGMLEAPTDKIYVLDESAAYGYTINTLIAKTVSGTLTAAIKINGTNVTGISAVSVTSTPATGTSSAARTVAIGDRVTLVVSSSSTPVDLSFTLKTTRS